MDNQPIFKNETIPTVKPVYAFGCDDKVLFNPTTEELIAGLQGRKDIMVMLAIAIGLTVLTFGIFLESLIYVCRRIPSRRKVQLLFVMGIYPVFSLVSLVALFVPRAALISHFTGQIYFSIALVQFIMLLTGYYGSKDLMLNILRGQTIPIGSPPILIFCICCWPSIPINKFTIKKFVRIVRIMVIQTAVFKPLMLFIAGVLWMNGNYTPGNFSGSDPFLAMEIIMLFSQLLALNGIIMTFRISKDVLKEFNLAPKFFTVQLTLIILAVQGFVVGLMTYLGGIPCKPPMSPPLRALYYDKFLVIIEMFCFNIFATIWFRRLTGNITNVDIMNRRKKYGRLLSVQSFKEMDQQMVVDGNYNTTNNNSTQQDQFVVGIEAEGPDYKKIKKTDDGSFKSEQDGFITNTSRLSKSESDRETDV